MSESDERAGVYCYECGEELWSVAEACGLCVACQRLDTDDLAREHVDLEYGAEDDDADE